MKHFKYKRFGLIGFGSIGKALTECLVSHHGVLWPQFSIVVADEDTYQAGKAYALDIRNQRVTKENYQEVLESLQLKPGDVLINVALDVCSKDVLAWCTAREIHYLDTWLDAWTTPVSKYGEVEVYENWPLRQEILRDRPRSGPTSVICHGANPGIVSHFLKDGLHSLAERLDISTNPSEDIAQLSHRLGVCAIQIAEHDTQRAAEPTIRDGYAIISTWAPDSLATEAKQCAEIAWGTHEQRIPSGWSPIYPESPALISDKPGAQITVEVGSLLGYCEGFVLPHFEAFSIADRLTVVEDEKVIYRPTVYYAYCPAPESASSIREWVKSGYEKIEWSVLLNETLIDGYDALGLLFILRGHAYWYGSSVHVNTARSLNPNMNATATQVVGSVIAALAWMFENPDKGVVEPEEMDSVAVLKIARPYLGIICGEFLNFGDLTPETIQFNNFLVKGNE